MEYGERIEDVEEDAAPVLATMPGKWCDEWSAYF
jgi:hypothetical protein